MTASRLSILLAILAAISLTVFGSLGWRFLHEREQTRLLLVDRLTQTAALITREVDAEFIRWEAMAGVVDNIGGLPPSATRLVFDSDGVTVVSGEPLPYYPAVARPEVPRDGRLERAQEAELQKNDLDAAIAAYRDAASSTGRTVRATATAGLARCLSKQGKTQEALAAYEELAGMYEAQIDGIPARLIAHRERQVIFTALGDAASAGRERGSIAAELLVRKRIIDRRAFDAFATTFAPGRYPASAIARADAVAGFWPLWHKVASGRVVGGAREAAVAAVWRPVQSSTGSPASRLAIVAPVDVLMATAVGVARPLATSVSLEDSSGKLLWGERAPPAGSASISLGNIGLSASLRVWLKEP